MKRATQYVKNNDSRDASSWNYDASVVMVRTWLSPPPETWERLQHMTRLRSVSVYGCHDMRTLPLPFGTGGVESVVVQPQQYPNYGEDMQLTCIPDAIAEMRHLHTLTLNFCVNLRWLPDALTDVTSLRHLSLYYCTGLTELPRDVGRLWRLEIVNLCRCSALSSLPASVGRLRRLRLLNLDGCNRLEAPEEALLQLSGVRIQLPTTGSVFAVGRRVNERNNELCARQLTLVLAERRRRRNRLPAELHQLIIHEFLRYLD
jgi:hypothetical protein